MMRAGRLIPPAFRGVSIRALRDAFAVFRPALQGQGWWMTGSVLMTLVVTALELLRPWPMKVLFDQVLIPETAGPGAGLFGLSAGATVTLVAGATVGISVLLATLNVQATLIAARVAKKVTVRMRRQVFEHLHRLSFPFHQSSRTGDLLIRLMGDVNAVRDALFTSWVNLLSRALLFVGTAVVMFLIQPWLALLALWPLPMLALELGSSSRRLREVTRKQRRREGDAASFAAETLRQIRLVKAYAAEDRATQLFSRESRSGERAGMRATRISARMDQLTEIMTGAGLALVLLVGAHWVLADRITPGDLLVFASYTRSLYKPLRKASGEGARLSKASACAGRLLEILRIPPEGFGEGTPAPRFEGALSVRDVFYRYDRGVEALRGLSMEVAPGALAVIRGPNGSGKSTLLSTLLRLVEPEEGEVLIDGQPIRSFELASYRNRFAYVPQDIQLFGGTIRENILYGRPDATDLEVERAAEAAMLQEVAARLPGGLDAVLGENGATLSGGEARRVMLARAALRSASVLLLDEPLAGLDPEARALVGRAIRRTAAGRTTLVISHGPSVEIDPDVVFHIRDGRVQALTRHPGEAPDDRAMAAGPDDDVLARVLAGGDRT